MPFFARCRVRTTAPFGFEVVSKSSCCGISLTVLPGDVDPELARGEVVAPLAGTAGKHVAQEGYFLCYPQNKASLEPLLALADWLRAEVGAGDASSTVEAG